MRYTEMLLVVSLFAGCGGVAPVSPPNGAQSDLQAAQAEQAAEQAAAAPAAAQTKKTLQLNTETVKSLTEKTADLRYASTTGNEVHK